jgi:hypothetical protein
MYEVVTMMDRRDLTIALFSAWASLANPARLHRNDLQTLPGFLNHMVFEKADGPTEFNLITIAIWESRDAISAAADRVRSYYQSIGFDVPATLARLGITASLGYYTAPGLQ